MMHGAKDSVFKILSAQYTALHYFPEFLKCFSIYLEVDRGTDKGFTCTGERKLNVYSHKILVIFSEFAPKRNPRGEQISKDFYGLCVLHVNTVY